MARIHHYENWNGNDIFFYEIFNKNSDTEREYKYRRKDLIKLADVMAKSMLNKMKKQEIVDIVELDGSQSERDGIDVVGWTEENLMTESNAELGRLLQPEYIGDRIICHESAIGLNCGSNR